MVMVMVMTYYVITMDYICSLDECGFTYMWLDQMSKWHYELTSFDFNFEKYLLFKVKVAPKVFVISEFLKTEFLK